MLSSPPLSPLDRLHNGFFTSSPRVPAVPTINTYVKSPHMDAAAIVTLSPVTPPASASTSKASPATPFAVLTATSKDFPERAMYRSRANSWQTQTPPLSLPAAAVAENTSPTIGQSSMSEAFGGNKASGLIRRLSRGAHNRLRRRASSTFRNRIRDQSAGPVLARRRSDSIGPTDLAGDLSDLDLEPHSEDGAEDNASSFVSAEAAVGLGIGAGRKSTAASFEGGIAPTIPSILERGTWLIKVTKKKRKTFKFRLDTLAAKVCWDASKTCKQFYIDDVRDIRVGADAKNSREDIQVPAGQEDCWMTIVYDVPEGSKGRTIKTMHLIAQNDFIVKLWTDALNVVSRERIEIMNALSPNHEKSERSMRLAWKQVMARKRPDVEQKIDFEGAKWICRKLEINCSSDAIRRHFNQSDRDLIGMLSYTQYESFVNLFKFRQDVATLYRDIKPTMELELSLETFLKFLREVQHVDVDKDRSTWESRFESFCRSTSSRGTDVHQMILPSSMSVQAFQKFLTSSHNSCLPASKAEATLDRPLNEYFVSSSHNTYLLGRQVAGASSVEGYITALVKGCRCIEIDCWDGKDGRPVVNHGRTLSSEVLFDDCVSVIAKYAFASSSYPLVVSLEVHCNAEQQAAMVEIMKTRFGDSLLTMPLMTNTTALPSPEELRHRILVKVKSTHQLGNGHNIGDANGGSRQRSSSTPFSRGSQVDNSGFPLPPLPGASCQESPGMTGRTTWSTPQGSITSNTGASGSSSTSDSESLPTSSENKAVGKQSNIAPVLGALGVYTAGIKYTGFGAQEARMYNHIYSFAESTFDRLCKDTETKHGLEKHNLHYLMRVYPAARRIDSSNFNPLQSWKRGVQMAALNWQTYDVNLQINEAMFAAGTDRTGYVLKPDALRHAKHLPITDALSDSHAKKEKKRSKLVKFSVELISAQRLPRPRNHNPDLGMNPYIEFEMYSADEKARGIAKGEGGTDASARDGSSGIGVPLRKRSKIAEGNGFDPVFKESIQMTVETKYSSLIFVRCTVWNSPDGRTISNNNTMLATFTAKLSSLQQGYRHFPLFNAYGERYRDAKLFVKIRKEAPIALHSDDSSYGVIESSGSPRPELAKSERSWSRKIFSRTSSDTKKRDQSPFGSFSRTSSRER